MLMNKKSKKTKSEKRSVPLAERDDPSLILDLVMEALRIQNDRLNAIAAEFITRFGEKPVRRLVLEAACRQNRPAHRVRLLRIIQRIGLVDTETWIDVFNLIHDQNPEVRAAAAELICTLRGPALPRAEGPWS
jgi:hypothetical protein